MCRRRHSGRRFCFFGHHRGLSPGDWKNGDKPSYSSFGNVLDIFEFPMLFGARGLGIPILGHLVLGIFGLCSGIFVGCLVMSLAETLKALPVISRRIRLAVGLQYVILSVALGKLFGCLVYFLGGMGS